MPFICLSLYFIYTLFSVRSFSIFLTHVFLSILLLSSAPFCIAFCSFFFLSNLLVTSIPLSAIISTLDSSKHYICIYYFFFKKKQSLKERPKRILTYRPEQFDIQWKIFKLIPRCPFAGSDIVTGPDRGQITFLTVFSLSF